MCVCVCGQATIRIGQFFVHAKRDPIPMEFEIKTETE